MAALVDTNVFVYRHDGRDPRKQRLEELLHSALRATAAYQLSWFDAQMWAYADLNGLTEILSEDFQTGRMYGRVRIVNPFA